MYYEDVKVKKGETVSGIAMAYGYKADEWRKIWDDPKNADLVKKRGVPEHLQIGDILYVKIAWKVVTHQLTTDANGASFLVQRDGAPGKRTSWVQTVYRHNQPIGPNPSPFCVDACTPDDNLPFYWTDAEVAAPPQWVKDFSGDPKVNLTKTFADRPSRNAPTAAMGTTKWRAVTSIAIMNEHRVTVFDSWVWGFDLTPAGVSTKIGPRVATNKEVEGHLNLLKNGKGTGADTFGKQGWSFRTPPLIP